MVADKLAFAKASESNPREFVSRSVCTIGVGYSQVGDFNSSAVTKNYKHKEEVNQIALPLGNKRICTP